MSGVLNDCDALLQGASVRILNPDSAFINLTASAPGFHITGAGAVDLATVTITADLIALDGDVVFTGQGVTLSNVKARSVDASYVSGTGIVTATVVTNGETFARSYIIPVLRDGVIGGSAKVLTLAPSEQVFKVAKDGANSPASITLTASGQNLGGTPSFTVPVGTATLTAGANASQKILTFANMATDSVTVQVAQDGQADRVTIVKVREGADGIDAITGLLTNESVTLPASSAGVVSSFSGAECSMKVYKGVSDDTANWAFAYAPASSASSLAYAATAGTVTITGMAAGVDTAYVDITASKSGAASITKRFTVTKSRAGSSVTGARGAGHYYVAGSSWSDVVAQAACPGGPVVNDVVTISSGTFVMEKRWTGSAWVDNGVVINGKLIVPDSILASAIDARGLVIRDAQGNVILGAGSALAAGFEAPGTRNGDQPLSGNLIPENSLPSSLGNFSAGSGLAAGAWEGPIFGAPAYSPRGHGSVYTHAFNTPAAGTTIDLYLNAGERFDVVSGRRYEFGVALSAHRCAGKLVAIWYDSSGAYVGETGGNAVTVGTAFNTPGGFPRSTIITDAPAAATTVMLLARQTHLGGAGGNDPHLFSSEWRYGLAGATQTVPSPYSESPAGLGTARKAASDAKASATAAAQQAALAIKEQESIASDNVLSKGEKPGEYAKWELIFSQKPGIVATATSFGLSAAALDSAYTALSTYLTGLGVQWYTIPGENLTIEGAVYKAKFKAYYDALQTLTNAISVEAGKRAQWASIGGTGKPSDNATVGATIGINLGGQFNSGNVPSLFVAGAITDTQIGGNLKSSNWNGSTGVGGQGWLLERATGNLYANNVFLRGALMSANVQGWGVWPAAGAGKVAYFGPEGIMLGNYNDGRFVHAFANGNWYMPGFAHENGQLTLTNSVMVNPNITGANLNSFTITLSGNANGGSYPNGSSGYGYLQVNIVGPGAPFIVQWVLSKGITTGNTGGIQMSATTGLSTEFSGTGTNSSADCSVSIIVTDKNGLAKTLSHSFGVNHGTPI